MLTTFRITAILEGISYLMLFAISMPLKYWAGIREPNIYIGYAHGALFIAYLLVAIVFWMEKKWTIKRLLVLLLASLLPFGTFYMDKKYLKPLQAD
jgi:integral membrane protein